MIGPVFRPLLYIIVTILFLLTYVIYYITRCITIVQLLARRDEVTRRKLSRGHLQCNDASIMNQFQLQLQFRKSRAANQIGGFFVRFLGIWKRISQKTSSIMLRNSNRNWNSQLHNFLRSIQRRFGFQIDPAGFVDIRKNIHFRKLKAIQFFRSNDERVAVAAQFRSNWLFGIENCNFQAKIASRTGRGLARSTKIVIYNLQLQFTISKKPI